MRFLRATGRVIEEQKNGDAVTVGEPVKGDGNSTALNKVTKVRGVEKVAIAMA
jgi:hypothetical protein